jgi:hypothetical protein
MNAFSKLILLLLVAPVTQLRAGDVLSDLSISQGQAEGFVADSITNGHLYFPPNARAIPAASRAAVVQAVGALAQAYVQTDDFKSRYTEWWKSQEPGKPQSLEAKAAEEKQREEDSAKEQAKILEDLKGQIKTSEDPAVKKVLQEMLAGMVKMQADMKAATETPEYKRQMKEAQEAVKTIEAAQYQQDVADYQKKLTQWQEEQNPKVLIKRGLEKFLSDTGSVDFDAALSPDSSGKLRFVKEEYQHKDDVWKQAFRAGKPAVEAARRFAQEWLKTL